MSQILTVPSLLEEASLNGRIVFPDKRCNGSQHSAVIHLVWPKNGEPMILLTFTELFSFSETDHSKIYRQKEKYWIA